MAINHESKAIGVSSFSSGFSSEARGNYSVALGLFTKARARSSIALGQYNIGNGNPTSQILTDPIFEIGNGINSANRSNAMTILKNGNTGIGVLDPTENLEIERAIKIGPNNNANSLNGTIRFQNNDIEARIGNNWKSLTSNFGNEVDSLTVSEYPYIGEPNTGYYFEDFGEMLDHGKSLIFSKPTTNQTGFVRLDFPRRLENQGDFCFLETGPNPYFRINLGNSNYYFKKKG